jgi:hypothetical protein
MSASCVEGAARGKAEREGENNDEETARFYHGNENRCTLIAVGRLATRESECRGCA